MKPVYFPYTYLSPSVAHSLRAVFSSVAVYQPVAGRLPDEMRLLAEEGFLEVMTPPPGDEMDFDRLMRDFQRWGSLHQGGAGLQSAVLSGRPFSGPISADGSPAEIVSDIRRRLVPEAGSRDRGLTLTARVFLQLAQAADQLGHQIGRGLALCEKAQAQLFETLKGEAGQAGSGASLWERLDADAARKDRVDLRTAAWARLYSSRPYLSPVFVTSGQAVIRHLAEHAPACLRFSFAELSPVLQSLTGEKQPLSGDIMSQLVALAAAPLPPPDPPHGDADDKPAGGRAEEPCVHLWPQIPPRRFFGRIPTTAPAEFLLPPSEYTWRNTVIVRMG